MLWISSSTLPWRSITMPTTLSPKGSASGSPMMLRALAARSWMSTTLRPAAFRRSAISGRAGLTAMPYSVTTTSTPLPGVMRVVTFGTTQGMRPRRSGHTMMERALSSAVSGWPPMAPRMMPSEPTSTLTLKSTSTSRADRITMSRACTAEPTWSALAYSTAETSWWSWSLAMDSAATLSKDWTSMSRPIRPSSCSFTIWAVMPPRAKEAWMPFSIMLSRMYLTAAREAPPVPVWMLNPSLK